MTPTNKNGWSTRVSYSDNQESSALDIKLTARMPRGACRGVAEDSWGVPVHLV